MNPLPHRRSILGALAAIVLMAAPALAADPVFPLNSRIGLVPPPGFTPSTKFVGFENEAASAAVVIAELPAEAYAELEKGFTDEAFKARGMTVMLREPVTFKDGRGIVIAGPRAHRRREAPRDDAARHPVGRHRARVGADDRSLARHNHGRRPARRAQDDRGAADPRQREARRAAVQDSAISRASASCAPRRTEPRS